MNDAIDTAQAEAEDLRSTINQGVRGVALLAHVSISVWSGERTDHAIMDQAKANAGAVGNVGRAIKNLMAGADGNLKECRSAYVAMRTAHYGMTLPFVSDPTAERQRGPRLLPNSLFMDYLNVMGEKRRAAHAALDAFCDGYDDDAARARQNLAGLADATYPTVDQVRALFRAEFEFTPIPAGTDFVNLPDAIVRKLATTLADRQATAVASAMAGMWETTKERLTHLADVMRDPEKRFHATTVEHAADLGKLLPAWAIDGDGRAIEIADGVRTMLDGVTPKLLRSDGALRAEVADRARALVEKLAEWGV